MNSYFGGPNFQPNPAANGAAGNPMDGACKPLYGAAHNPAGPSYADYGAGPPFGGANDSSKLMTKWGHPMDYGKMQQSGEVGGGGAFTPYGAVGGTPWSEPPQMHHSNHHHAQQQQQYAMAQFGSPQVSDAAIALAESKFTQLSLKAPTFQPAGIPHQQATSGMFTPPVDLGIRFCN